MAAAAVHAAAPVSFSYTGPAVAIPDLGAEVGAPIAVSGLFGNVANVTLRIDGSPCTAAAPASAMGIDHTWVGDLVLRLRSPAGTVVTAVSRLGQSGTSTFGHGANHFCQLTLDDGNAASVQTAPNSGPVTGSYKPANPFAGFVGQAPNGNWTLLAQDFASTDTGNIRAWTITITPQDATTTTLASSVNPSTLGQPVSLTATVATTGAAPTGTVDFLDGATPLCTAVTPTAGLATCTTSALAVGSHSLTAVYAGDVNTAPSGSAVLTQVVSPAASATSVSSSLNPSAFSQSVTFSSTVTGASPTGTVSFLDGATVLCTVPLSAVTASCTTSALAVGSHSITAQYAGDTNNTGSSSAALSQTVSRAVSTITLTGTPSAPFVGQSVTLAATVAGVTPGGMVTFYDGANPVCTAVAVATAGNAATASCTTPSLDSNAHSFTAGYLGDTNNAPSLSAALVVTALVVAPVPALSPALLLLMAVLMALAAVWQRRRAG